MKNKKRNRTFTILSILMIFLILPVLFSCKEKKQEKKEETRVPVVVSMVKKGTVSRTLRFVGTFRADNSVEVFSKIAGRVKKVMVEEGDTVNRGQLLVQLEDDEIKAQLQQARAALQVAKAQLQQARAGYGLTSSSTGIQVRIAKRGLQQSEKMVAQAQSRFEDAKLDYNRMKQLYEKGAVSRQAFDKASTAFEVAKSQLEAAIAQKEQAEENLDLARANTRQEQVQKSSVQVAAAGVQQAQANVLYMETMLDNTRLTAPLSGVVTFRRAEPGQLLSPGNKKPVITITDNSVVYLSADIPESEMRGIQKGKKVRVFVDSLGNREFTGKIKTVIASADPASRSFRIKVAVKNPDNVLKNGMSAVAEIVAEKFEGPLVMRDWLKVIEGEFYVVKAVPDDGKRKAIHQKVIPAYYNEEKAVIKDGLKVGEMVISTGQETLRDNDLVEIKRSASPGDVPTEQTRSSGEDPCSAQSTSSSTRDPIQRENNDTTG